MAERSDRAARPELPVQPTRLLGRSRDLAEASQLLTRGDVRLLTLTGAAGTGKTRLAVALAEAAAPAFPDGIVFVDLSPVADPDQVLASVTRALRLPEAAGVPAAETLRASLADRRRLLLLDNFEQVLAAAPGLADLLGACPGLTLLVTSRAPLHLSWEHELPVPPLALPDPEHGPDEVAASPAVALFAERARAVDRAFALTPERAPAVVEICRRLDGLPLAIELAAARVKLLTPADLLARLEGRFALLAGGRLDQPERHRTLRAALDWSHDLLGAPEQRLLRRLGVFVGGWTLAAAEAVAGDDRQVDVLDGLAALVDASLVRRLDSGTDQTRYGMFETIRAYAAERLDESGEAEAVGERHAAHFLAQAEELAPHLDGQQPAAWLDRVEVQSDNFRAALRWLAERGRTREGLRLATALFGFWFVRGHFTEARFELGRFRSAEQGLTVMHFRASSLAGLMALRQGDYRAARALYGEGLTVARALGDGRSLASALLDLGRLLAEQGEHEEAQALLTESVAVARTTDDPAGLSVSLHWLAQIHRLRGDYAAAVHEQEEGLALLPPPRDTIAAGYARSHLGLIFAEQEEYATARRHLAESLAVQRAVGNRRAIALDLYRLGGVLLAEGDRAGAAGLFRESLTLSRELGDRLGLARALEACAAAAAQGAPATAVRLSGVAAGLRDAMGTPPSAAERRRLEQTLGQARSALGAAAFAEAVGRAREVGLDAALDEALTTADARPPGAGKAAGLLSAREQEVAHLIVQGCTNRQVAEQLVIAEATAERHVANIMAKLGVRARAQIAAWAVEHLPAGV